MNQEKIADYLEAEQTNRQHLIAKSVSSNNQKTSSICTLFEGNYHFGMAVLINSLYANGFRGDIYAGYRGSLPHWAEKANINKNISWKGVKTLTLTDELSIHFLPLETDYHLTNYKPDFMLKLWEGPAEGINQLFYFDPDIVVDAKWSFFVEWAGLGVALCEDINSPLPQNHPRRKGWRQYYRQFGINLHFKEGVYANGGFVGVSAEQKSFLEMWKILQEKMAPEIGGLGVSQFIGTKDNNKTAIDPNSPFNKTDQDALNATVEAWPGEVSFIGQEAMGFKRGGVIMPHAIGGSKPWNRNSLQSAFSGIPPRIVDKKFWQYADGLISIYNPAQRLRKQMALHVASLIGRFYKRS